MCGALPAAAAGGLTVISFGRSDHAALVAAYVEPFARTTGIAVHSLSYDGQVTELTQMVQAGAPVWDVMQVESRTLEQGCRLGLFEKLDAAEKGERITIARGGKPVAQLGPAPRRRRSALLADDPLLNLDPFAVEGPGGALTNADIDRTLYGGS